MSSHALAAGIRYIRSRMAGQHRNEESDEQLLLAFTARRDEDAFAVLVRRHGPMVLNVCRRVLGQQQDAEDAFQATFLLLARSAASLRKKTALAGFLHGAAYRIALTAKRSAARRRKHEGTVGPQMQPRSPSDPADEISWREVRALLDEEIAHLQDTYRTVFVLCCLENLSQAEAARRLGLKERTLSSRLAVARKRLAQRLARRGVELTAVLAATALATAQVSALPAGLMTTTIQAALSTVAGEGLPGVVSASVAELVQATATAMMVSKAKIAVVLVITATLLSGTGVFFLASPQRQQGHLLPARPAGKQNIQAPRSEKHEPKNAEEIRGRVVDPDGKPVRGAKIVFTYTFGAAEKIPHKIWAVSDADGRFAFALPLKEMNTGFSRPRKETYVVAAAEGYGYSAARLGKPGTDDLTLRLVKDDVPIRGRIIDLQGKPVAGIRVHIADKTLVISDKSDLTDWLAALKTSKENRKNVESWNYWKLLYSPAFDLLFPTVTTGADGRFEMKGIGRERLAHLRIEGPTIATQEVQVMTRANEKIQIPQNWESPKGPMNTYYGADFELLAAPSRPIVGVVRDRDTGKPLAGVKVESTRIGQQSGFVNTTTDKDGRYRLEGLPKGDGYEIAARADDWAILPGKEKLDQLPYLATVKKVGNSLGLEPVTIDFALKRGVWIEGCVKVKGTGKPLEARIQYFCFNDNPNVKEFALGGSGYNDRFSREDGFFRIPVMPGHGLIGVRAYSDHYIMGIGAEKIKGPRDRDQSDVFITTPYICFAGNFHTLVEIDPKAGEESINCDVVLDPGRALKGTVLDPDGKPLAGARISGMKDMGYFEENADSEFTVNSLKPNKPRLLQFVHDGKKLSGHLVLNGDEKDPFQVRLNSWGTLTGRVLTPLGAPLTSVRVNCWTQVKHKGQVLHSAALAIRPDKDGQFRIEGLIAGLEYELSVARSNVQQNVSGGNPNHLAIKPGEMKDLGDLTVKPAE